MTSAGPNSQFLAEKYSLRSVGIVLKPTGTTQKNLDLCVDSMNHQQVNTVRNTKTHGRVYGTWHQQAKQHMTATDSCKSSGHGPACTRPHSTTTQSTRKAQGQPAHARLRKHEDGKSDPGPDTNSHPKVGLCYP